MKKDQHQQSERSYVAFLIRMWRDSGGSHWRGSAQSVLTGEVVRFASIPLLLHYLHSHITVGASPDDRAPSALAADHESPELPDANHEPPPNAHE